jgi:purine/pyrimidine-nucleoside phosphorylase
MSHRALASARTAGQSPAMSLPTSFTGVTVHSKANVYFDGRVVSHTVLMPDGAKKTLGLIYPGSYHFGTGAPERMEIIAGVCDVTIDGQVAVKEYAAGSSFEVPGKSGFTIEVKEGLCEYICSFL